MRRAGPVCQDLGMSVKSTKNQLREAVDKSWIESDRIGLTKPGSDRTGLTKPGSDRTDSQNLDRVEFY